MVTTVRCPHCRGAKKVPQLGGIIGNCRLCKGDGQIKQVDKPVEVIANVAVDVTDGVCEIRELVANVVPEPNVVVIKPKVSAKPKRAYNRKRK